VIAVWNEVLIHGEACVKIVMKARGIKSYHVSDLEGNSNNFLYVFIFVNYVAHKVCKRKGFVDWALRLLIRTWLLDCVLLIRLTS
jgi:hypothetical protein